MSCFRAPKECDVRRSDILLPVARLWRWSRACCPFRFPSAAPEIRPPNVDHPSFRRRSAYQPFGHQLWDALAPRETAPCDLDSANHERRRPFQCGWECAFLGWVRARPDAALLIAYYVNSGEHDEGQADGHQYWADQRLQIKRNGPSLSPKLQPITLALSHRCVQKSVRYLEEGAELDAVRIHKHDRLEFNENGLLALIFSEKSHKQEK